jgi:hypothetical protein
LRLRGRWASCLWLVAHRYGGRAVGECHSQADSNATLRALVGELLPIARKALGEHKLMASSIACVPTHSHI